MHIKLLVPDLLEPLCVGLVWLVERVGRAKESCDSSLSMSLCGCIVVLQYRFLCLLSSSKNITSSTVGPHIPLRCVVAKAVVKEAMVFPCHFVEISNVTNIVLFRFHSFMTQLANSFVWRCACIFAY